MATKEHLVKRTEEINMLAGFRYSLRKMEAAAQDRAGWK